MFIIFLIIALLSLGGLGGSFQPSRLLILLSPFLLPFFMKKPHLNFDSGIKYGLKFYFLWLVYGIISLMWSADPETGLSSEIIVMFIGMLSLMMFPYYLQYDEKSVKLIRNAWIAGYLITLPIAFYEITTMQHFSYTEEERLLGGIGDYFPFASVFFGNYNNYCVYICLCFPFMFWGFVDSQKKLWKIFYALLAGIGILIILINTNRTSIVIFVLYLLSFIRFNWRSLFTFIGLLVILVGSYQFLPASLQNSLDILFNYRVNVDYSQDESGLLRLGLFNDGIRFLEDSYGFGSGAGSFETLMLKSPNYDGISNPHNIFLEILSQYGILIFGGFLVWLIIIARGIYKNTSYSPSVKRIFYIAIICIPIIGIINSDALGYTVWWVYFTSLAMLAFIDYKKPELLKEKHNFES